VYIHDISVIVCFCVQCALVCRIGTSVFSDEDFAILIFSFVLVYIGSCGKSFCAFDRSAVKAKGRVYDFRVSGPFQQANNTKGPLSSLFKNFFSGKLSHCLNCFG